MPAACLGAMIMKYCMAAVFVIPKPTASGSILEEFL